MIARTMFLLVVVVVGLVGADDPATTRGFETLQGTWTLVSSEIRGLKMAIDPSHHNEVIIDGDKLTATRGGKVSHTSTIRIDPSKTAMHMDTIFERDGIRSVGLAIYKLEGDTLTVCSAFEGDERPERFESTEKTSLTVLKKAEPKATAP